MDAESKAFNIDHAIQLKSSIPCYAFLKYCEAVHGIKVNDLLLNTGLIEADINYANALISKQQLAMIKKNALNYFGPFMLGVLWGQAASIKSLCIFGVYISSAQTIKDVLLCTAELERLLGCHLFQSHLALNGDYASIELLSQKSITTENRRIAEGMFVGKWLRLFSDLGVGHVNYLQFDPSLSLSLDEQLMQVLSAFPMVFTQSKFRIVLAKSDLLSLNPGADERAYELANKECHAFLKKVQVSKTNDNIASLVSHLIQSRLSNGDEKTGYYLQQENIALVLGVSSSTLNRRLKLAGVSFQELLDGVREQVSCFYLKQGDVSVKHVASKLGYRDVANFRRAFKRWTGLSPSEYSDKSMAGSIC
jgi:AraC-like DNA-binding protein